VALTGLTRRGATGGWRVAKLQQRLAGQTAWTVVKAPLPDGAWTITRRPRRAMDYRVVSGNARGQTEHVAVRTKVTMSASGRSPTRMRGAIRPAGRGVRVTLHRRGRDGSWTLVSAIRTGAGGRFSFTVSRRPGTYRARADAGTGLLAGSATVTLRPWDTAEHRPQPRAPYLLQGVGHPSPIAFSSIRTRLAKLARLAEARRADGSDFVLRPHDCRLLFGSEPLNNNVPVHVSQALLGHAHVDTVMDYAKLYPGTLVEEYRKAVRPTYTTSTAPTASAPRRSRNGSSSPPAATCATWAPTSAPCPPATTARAASSAWAAATLSGRRAPAQSSSG
jgi:integrase-like protein